MKKNKLYIHVGNNDLRTSVYKPPPIKFMTELNWKIIDSQDKIIYEESEFLNYLENNNIGVIIMFTNFDTLLRKYCDYLVKNNIYFLIYENDLHYLNTREKNNNKGQKIREFYQSLDNVLVCANYYYCYLKFFNIKPNRIIKYPPFVDDDFMINFNNNPINKILLSGSKSKEYPARKKLRDMAENNANIDILKQTYNVYGYDYIKYLNNYLCSFSCCLNKNTPYIVGKFFEIPSSGSLLLAYDEYVKEELHNLGFIDGVNYISCNLQNMEEKIKYILDEKNRDEIDKIRKNGYDFVWKYHKQSDRLKYINNFIETII